MKAATQSCSGKKAFSKLRQNPQKTPTKEIKKKSPPQAYLGPELLRFKISRTPIFRNTS